MENHIVMMPNMIIPYGYEIVPIMAYPAGFIYRFRFDEEWLSDRIKADVSSLSAKKGYIVFRDPESATFYPIRHITIKVAQRIGKYYYFEYELNEIFDFDSNETWRTKQITQFNDSFKSFHESEFKDNIPGKDMKPLVFLTNFAPTINNEHVQFTNPLENELERWGNIISIIKNIKFYENVEFIKILDIVPMKKRDEEVQVKENYLFVQEDGDYKLRIFQLKPKGSVERIEPKDIEVRSDDKYISVIRNKQRAVGKYDVLSFVFRVHAGSGGQRSYLDVLHAPKTEAAQYIAPTLYLPVAIQGKRKLMVIRILFAFVLVSFYLFPEAISFISDHRIVKDFAMVLFTISVIDILKEIRDLFKANR